MTDIKLKIWFTKHIQDGWFGPDIPAITQAGADEICRQLHPGFYVVGPKTGEQHVGVRPLIITPIPFLN